MFDCHFAEDAFALHFLLQRLERLIDIVVANQNLHAFFPIVLAPMRLPHPVPDLTQLDSLCDSEAKPACLCHQLQTWGALCKRHRRAAFTSLIRPSS